MSRFFTTPKKPLAVHASDPSQPTRSYSHSQPFVAFQAVQAHLPNINDTLNGATRRHVNLGSQNSSDDGDGMDLEAAAGHDNMGDQFSVDGDSQRSQEEPEHASSVSYDPSTCLLLRLLQYSTILEIRSLALTLPKTSPPTTSADLVLRISFPSTLRPLPERCFYRHPVTGDMTIVLLSENNDIHRIAIPALGTQAERPFLDYDPKAGRGAAVTNSSTIQGWTGSWEVIDDVTFCLATVNGLSKFSWSAEAQGYSHTSIAIPSFPLARFMSIANPPSVASHAISLTSYLEGDTTAIIYTLSRDCKIRAWSVAGQAHQFMLDLSDPGNSGTLLEEGSSFVKAFGDVSSSSNLHYLAIYFSGQGQSNGHFKFAQVIYEHSQIRSIHILQTLSGGMSVGSRLRDFQVEAIKGPQEEGQESGISDSLSGKVVVGWILWTLWLAEETSTMRWHDIGRLLSTSNDAWEPQEMVRIGSNGSTYSIGETEKNEDWQTVSTPWADLDKRLDISYFDRIIPESLPNLDTDMNEEAGDLVKDIEDVFDREIFVPGRFSSNSISSTLEEYIISLQESHQDGAGGDGDGPLPPELSEEYTTLSEKVRAIVGCAYHVQRDKSTGRRMFAEYRRDVRGEWLGFWAGVKGKDRAGRWPLALVAGQANKPVLAICKEGIVGVQRQDEVGFIRRTSSGDNWENNVDSVMEIPTGQLRVFYPTLARQATRDILVLASAANTLAAEFSDDGMTKLNSDFEYVFSIPLEDSVEQIARRIWESSTEDDDLDAVFDLVEHRIAACARWRKGLHALMDMLVEVPTLEERPAREELGTFTGWSLAISALSQLILERLAVARNVMILVMYLTVGRPLAEELADQADEDLELLIRSFSAFHQLSVLKWIVEQTAAEASYTSDRTAAGLEDEGGLYQGFEQLRVGAAGLGQTYPDAEAAYSLLHSLFTQPGSPLLDQSMPGLSELASILIRRLGLLSSSIDLDASPQAVYFANVLVESGHPALALDMALWYPPSAGLAYVRGKALSLTSIGKLEEACQQFEAVSSKILIPEWRKWDNSGLERVLPADVVLGGLFAYYQHIMSIFEKSNYTTAVIDFAHLAVKSLERDNPLADALWTKIFRGYLALQKYEQAYSAMTQNPFAVFTSDVAGKDRPLGNLINAMCQHNEVDRLMKLGFMGLEHAVEEELKFKARNSDPLAYPNYNQVLYSWLMKMTDYRSAGRTMYLQGRQLGERLESGMNDPYSVASLQAQSYLAAISALSLVEEKNAWISMPVVYHGLLDRGSRKRRKIHAHIPATEFSEYRKEVDVVTLQDIRGDYANALAILKVARVLGPSLSLPAILEHQCDDDLFDDAIATGKSLGSDLTLVFEALAKKCILLVGRGLVPDDDAASWLEISPISSAWRGSPSDKAWSYLQLQLERCDTEAADFKYRKTVIAVLLAGKCVPPSWLVEFGQGHFPEKLVQLALKSSMPGFALEWTVDYIRKSPMDKPAIPGIQASFPTYTSYTTIDKVIQQCQTGTIQYATELKALNKDVGQRFERMKA